MSEFSLYQKVAMKYMARHGMYQSEIDDAVLSMDPITLEAKRAGCVDELIAGIRGFEKYYGAGFSTVSDINDAQLKTRLLTGDKDLERRLSFMCKEGLDRYLHKNGYQNTYESYDDDDDQDTDERSSTDYISGLCIAVTKGVHDQRNKKKLYTQKKDGTNHQYLPFEMAGNECCKVYLDVAMPLLDIAGFSQYISEKIYHDAYGQSVTEFRIDNGLDNLIQVVRFIDDGADNYIGLQDLNALSKEDKKTAMEDVIADFKEHGAYQEYYTDEYQHMFLNINKDGRIGDLKIASEVIPVSVPVICMGSSPDHTKQVVYSDGEYCVKSADGYDALYIHNLESFTADSSQIMPLPDYDLAGTERSEKEISESDEQKADKQKSDRSSARIDVRNLHRDDNESEDLQNNIEYPC